MSTRHNGAPRVHRLSVVDQDLGLARSARVLILPGPTDDAIAGSSLEGQQHSWTADAIDFATGAALVDVVLLQLSALNAAGPDICRAIRSRQPDVVIIVLADRDDDPDIVTSLNSGADDYITTPFVPFAWLALMQAHLRRRPLEDLGDTVLHCGDLRMYLPARECTLAGQPVRLRPKQFELLERLARDTGKTVTQADLVAEVWGDRSATSPAALELHVAALRQRLTDVAETIDTPLSVPWIRARGGAGYRLEAVALS
jgi:DNA-binding response OmpR family regulator